MTLRPLLISSPGDMLRKARYDLDIMRTDLNAYTAFNFFVTCYHVRDYIKKMKAVPKTTLDQLDQLLKDPDFDMAGYLCDRGKHLVLTSKRRQKRKKKTSELYVGAVSGRALSGLARSGMGDWYVLYSEGREVKPIELGERLISKWEKFFRAHNIAE